MGDLSKFISIAVPTTAEPKLALSYNFETVTKPIFYNSTYYDSFKPIIKKVFTNDDGNYAITNCDFLSYIFPIDNTIQFTDNLGTIIKYIPYYIHFTHRCPIKFGESTLSIFSLIIECVSESNIPLLIIIPVNYTNAGDSNTNIDLLIEYSQSTITSINITTSTPQNIYINNIIPTETFIYFKQPVSNTIIGNCNIITFETSLKTKWNMRTTRSITNYVSDQILGSVTDVNRLIYTDATPIYVDNTNPLKSSNPALSSPSIAENDIYIDCSVVTDSTTPTTVTTITTKSKTAKNSAAFIMFLIIIFISSLFIYKWIFKSSNTSISKPPHK